MIIAIDRFIKWAWAEAEATPTIATKRPITFYKKRICTRFGIPAVLITDNGKKFTSAKFKELCTTWRIDLRLASVCHP